MGYFNRKSGYISDYEKIMDREGYTKTDNYGKQHNAVAYKGREKKGPHEHIGYDPKTGTSFWHGERYETKHNKIENDESIEEYEARVVNKYLRKEGLSDYHKKVINDTSNSQDAHGLLEDFLNEELFVNNSQGEYTYEKDEYGLRAYGNLKLDDSVKRNGYAQRTVGGEARLEDDDGGHLIGNRFAGSSEKENLVPQNRNLNRGGYKHFENEIEKKLKEGKKVYMDVQTYSHEGEERPTAFMINEIDEDLNGKRNWEAVSYTNVSSLEQAQWEKEIVEMDEKKDE